MQLIETFYLKIFEMRIVLIIVWGLLLHLILLYFRNCIKNFRSKIHRKATVCTWMDSTYNLMERRTYTYVLMENLAFKSYQIFDQQIMSSTKRAQTVAYDFYCNYHSYCYMNNALTWKDIFHPITKFKAFKPSLCYSIFIYFIKVY